MTDYRHRYARLTIPWRLALAWLIVAIMTMHYLVHPLANVALVYTGREPLPSLEPLSWSDLMAIIGGPVAGAFADRMAGETGKEEES